MGSREESLPANPPSGDAGPVRAKRTVKEPGLKQFEMDGIELEASALVGPQENRVDVFDRLLTDLDSLADKWKQNYEKKRTTRTIPATPPVTLPAGTHQVSPPTSNAPPQIFTGPIQPTYEGDAYPNVKWKDSSYGQSMLLDLQKNPEETNAVRTVVELLDKRKGVPGAVGVHALGIEMNGLAVYGVGNSVIVGAHRYYLGTGQFARFLNRQLAKPKEAPK